MSTKFVFASHHNLAAGLKDTVNYLTNGFAEIIDIPAYTDPAEDTDEIIRKIMTGFAPEDTIIVLVDMIGGSVCQKFYPYMSDRVHIISGMSLPLALPLILAGGEAVTKEMVNNLIREAREQIIYVNDYAIQVSEEDE